MTWRSWYRARPGTGRCWSPSPARSTTGRRRARRVVQPRDGRSAAPGRRPGEWRGAGRQPAIGERVFGRAARVRRGGGAAAGRAGAGRARRGGPRRAARGGRVDRAVAARGRGPDPHRPGDGGSPDPARPARLRPGGLAPSGRRGRFTVAELRGCSHYGELGGHSQGWCAPGRVPAWSARPSLPGRCQPGRDGRAPAAGTSWWSPRRGLRRHERGDQLQLLVQG